MAFEPWQGHDFDGIVGHDPKLLEQLAVVAQVADSDAAVLVEGESGTGKELVARAVHHASARRREPFVAVNCGALAESLLASELFGHIRGAFTGAVADKAGWFEHASAGTLFLDEVGEIPLALQASLLRVLECGEYSRVGSTAVRRSQARVVAATNQSLDDLVRRGRMRQDLRYRLDVVKVTVPPLRARRADLPDLIRHFLGRYNEKYGKEIEGVSPSAEAMLLSYSYPGNVRELMNALHRAVLLARGPIIEAASLPEALRQQDVTIDRTGRDGAFADTEEFKLAKRSVVEAFERDFLAQALTRTGGNVTRAAREVGLDAKNFRSKMKQYGLEASAFKRAALSPVPQ